MAVLERCAGVRGGGGGVHAGADRSVQGSPGGRLRRRLSARRPLRLLRSALHGRPGAPHNPCQCPHTTLLQCQDRPSAGLLCSAAAKSTWRHVKVVQGGKIAAWLSTLQGPLYFRSQMSPAMVTGAGWSSMEAQALRKAHNGWEKL